MKLEVERDTEHESMLGIVFNISPAQASVLSCLTKCAVASTKQLTDYTGGKSQIKVVVNHVRKALAKKEITIHSKQHVGYWIEADDKKKISSLVEEFAGSV